MSTKIFGTLVSTIDGVKNFHTPDSLGTIFSSQVQEYIKNLAKIANEVTGLGELERKLIEEFGTDILSVDGFRLANAIGIAGTQMRRHVESIILPNGETVMPTQTNLGGNVIDPVGWSSKVIAPSKGYGLFGKIPELRPNHENFDEALHSQVMSRVVKLMPKGIAIEVGPDEEAIMPIFSINGAEELSRFSQIKRETDVQTAKYYGINS